ncbi:MAG: hypothetical protein ACI8TX_002959, partial [Hyphomicrobiaceae bacterium]
PPQQITPSDLGSRISDCGLRIAECGQAIQFEKSIPQSAICNPKSEDS